ncbi:hypothetical protein LINGRAPRIM_LOCUS1312 [Linum grandiflorum]
MRTTSNLCHNILVTADRRSLTIWGEITLRRKQNLPTRDSRGTTQIVTTKH